MQFKRGATVRTADGKKVGTVDRVVMDPRTKEVTSIIVNKGFLFGDDKVVPISLIGTVEDEAEVHLREDAGDLDRLPNFTETEFVPSGVEETVDNRGAAYAQPYYYYPPIGVGWYAGVGAPLTYASPELMPVKEINIPEGTVALEEGADVITADDEHVGNVDAVLTEPEADRATHLVVSEGVLFPHRKLVPMQWVDTVLENEIHLAVPAALVDDLPEYEAPED